VAPVVPEDELAAAVAKIWAETLGVDVDEVARHGDFNVLGGDSISFLAMIAAVSRTLLADTDEQRFTDALADLIADPTLGAVTTLVRGLSLRRLDAA
jgi:acyl carrier protein